MKELEQKLELERSSARRHEAQIQRLRNQLERAQEDKSEDMVHKSSDALKRVQKQVRELRSELQEAERREQEQSKKRRIAVGWASKEGYRSRNRKTNMKANQLFIFVYIFGSIDGF